MEIDIVIRKMKTSEASKKAAESTYALLERSVDKKRALFETVLYAVIAVGALVAILQFTEQPVSFGA
jgi:hypothetical protein